MGIIYYNLYQQNATLSSKVIYAGFCVIFMWMFGQRVSRRKFLREYDIKGEKGETVSWETRRGSDLLLVYF